MSELTMKQMLEAGSHFGHQTKRWNPKMKKYIFGARNGIYIIDLQKSLKMFNEAVAYITEIVSRGDRILFVGTKKQAQDLIRDEATRCGMSHVNQRWLGGMMTNFSTIKKSINRLKKLEEMKSNGTHDLLTKKEVLGLTREEIKLEKFLGGIKNMEALPKALFIVDPRKEKIAFNEAKKLKIKTIALVDTNCDPDGIDYVIPGNDDAIRALKLIISHVAEAVLEGRAVFDERKMAIKKEAEEQEQKQKEAQQKIEEKKQEAVQKAKEAAKNIAQKETEKNSPKEIKKVVSKTPSVIKKKTGVEGK